MAEYDKMIKFSLGVLFLSLVLPSFMSGFVLGAFFVGVLSMVALKILVPGDEASSSLKPARRPVLLNVAEQDDQKEYKV